MEEELTATICTSASTENIAHVVSILNKNKRRLARLAEAIYKHLVEVIDDAKKETGIDNWDDEVTEVALALLAAARTYLYQLDSQKKKKSKKLPKQLDVRGLAQAMLEIKAAVERIELAWAHSTLVLLCPECKEKEDTSYI